MREEASESFIRSIKLSEYRIFGSFVAFSSRRPHASTPCPAAVISLPRPFLPLICLPPSLFVPDLACLPRLLGRARATTRPPLHLAGVLAPGGLAWLASLAQLLLSHVMYDPAVAVVERRSIYRGK